jgi:hypothetical protein
VPELDGFDDVSEALSAFMGSGPPSRAAEGPVARVAEPAEPEGPVTDEDRTRYGLLLDRAAERGLLEPHDYEIRLGELAAATSIDQLRRIVTELPAFVTPATQAAAKPLRSRRVGPTVTPGGVVAVGGRRRTSPWLLLGLVLLVVIGALVFFSIYAEHLVHSHTGAVPAWPPAGALSALRL